MSSTDGTTAPGATARGRTGWSPARFVVLVDQQRRLLWRERALPILYVAIPLVVCAFVRDTYGVVLRLRYPGATGAEVAVPGQAVLAAFLVLALLGWSMFLDHRWRTWPRLLAAPTRPSELLSARLSVAVVHLLVQFAVVFGAGRLLFDLRLVRSVAALVAVTTATVLMVVAYGAAAFALSRTNPAFDAFATVGALVLCGLGGAITPEEMMPSWARSAAPWTPVTWAMRGFRACFLSDVDGTVTRPVVTLLGFSAAFAAVAVLRYRVSDPKAASTRG